MEKPATKEFMSGISNTEGCVKYTPQSATVNNVKGYIWTKRVLMDSNWVHKGQQHVRSGAHEVEVTAAFDSDEEGSY